jgi:hypothetical protein
VHLTKYAHAHEAVIATETWYGDGPPRLNPSFSAAKTADRQAEVIDLLCSGSTSLNETGD